MKKLVALAIVAAAAFVAGCSVNRCCVCKCECECKCDCKCECDCKDGQCKSCTCGEKCCCCHH